MPEQIPGFWDDEDAYPGDLPFPLPDPGTSPSPYIPDEGGASLPGGYNPGAGSPVDPWAGWEAPEGGGFEGYGGSARPSYNFGNAPLFTAPKFPAYERFTGPNAESLLNDPGYKFRLGEGERALEQSAAGRGVLRTGGTLQDILKYGQQFASSEFGNAFDRDLRSYSTNFGVARDVFDRNYKGAFDEFTPKFGEWQFKAGAERDAGLAAFRQEYEKWALEQQINAGMDLAIFNNYGDE